MGIVKSTIRFNRIVIGIAGGILLPLLFLFLVFEIKRNGYGFFEYLEMNYSIGILPKIISLSLIPNLLLFYMFIQKNYLKSARGVLLAMFMFGFVIVILKFL